MQHVVRAWAGIDAGKSHHHVAVVDEQGRRVLSRKVANDEPSLLDAIDAVLTAADEVSWAIDLADGPAALVIALLHGHAQKVVYMPGVAVNRASSGYRGEGKTDAKDAVVIADQARMRHDLRELHRPDELAAELRLLTAHRGDIAGERTRAINRLRALLLGIFPALERVLDFTNRGPLVLVQHFQTADAINAVGRAELELWLREHKVRPAAKLAETVTQAADRHRVRLPGEAVAAELIARIAASVLELDAQLADLDRAIATAVHRHPQAAIITSMVGIGDLLGAEFIAATGGSLAEFASADHLAGYAGLAPAPRDSGRRTGNLHRPRRYSRRLQRVFYTSALISIQRSPASRDYYDRKRAQGKRHSQAVIALSRRRVNVLWAMLRDDQAYAEPLARSAPAA